LKFDKSQSVGQLFITPSLVSARKIFKTSAQDFCNFSWN